MLLWFFMVLGWVLVLVLAVSLFRLVGYADRKMRMRSMRARRRAGRAA